MGGFLLEDGGGLLLESGSDLLLESGADVVPFVPGSICISPEVGTLTVNGVSLNTPAWGILDLSELWASSPPVRRNNATLPGAAGRRPYPIRDDEVTWSLKMLISGVVDRLGVPYANDEIGLQTNLAYLRVNAFAPPVAPASTVPATLLLPDGVTTLTAAVQVTGFDRGQKSRGLMRAVLEITIPAGRFV